MSTFVEQRLAFTGGEEMPPVGLVAIMAPQAMTTAAAVTSGGATGLLSCCVPTECKIPLTGQDLTNAVRVICNNQDCRAGEYMHRECFEEWQEGVLSYLRSCGRARSWSEKQRMQNLWTRRGYDLAFKACGCKCGKGHLRKDTDWCPPTNSIATHDEKKKRGRKKRQNETATATGSVKPSVLTTNRIRSSSISSTGSGVCTPPTTPDQFASPIPRSSVNPFFNGDRSGNYEKPQQEVRLFSRRSDYSVFNCLPRHKINSYNIKMEDDDRSDDIRTFILTTLAQHRTTRIPCCVCHNSMNIFDRYPLLDGTLFLSPRQHSPGSVTIPSSNRTQYLNAVCMRCLEDDWQNLRCVACRTKWTGGHLIIGTLYSYDIFAAQPCCEERLRCNRCRKLVIQPNQRERYFFSDYSHSIACPSCKSIDYHFVKPLNVYACD
ncbi:headcase protein [Galendromus occidentalis]|uniref:Headcase protein n=1 Tax=Galendromus occidentalis TaxID=34638 RepID=A0AAJ7WHD5_9ACAR|nr:headcase protein [Galendromus occidentalis]